MLQWCRNNRDNVDLATTTAALTDEERFRAACGQTLDGRPVPEEKNAYLFYFRQGDNVSGLEYFGVRRALDFNDEPYVLVTAWMIQSSTEVGQKRKITETADAFLMGVHNGAWRTAWRYVDFEDKEWRRPASEDLGAEILSEDLEAFIDWAWQEQVMEATRELREAVAAGEATLIAEVE
jgi:hypothetical protein